MKKTHAITTSIMAPLLMLPLSSAMAAEGVSYSYIQGDYIVQDLDYFDEGGVFDNFVDDLDDGGGLRVGGSIELTDLLFAFGSYASTDSEYTYIDNTGQFISNDQDLKTLQLGIGFHTPLSDQVDVVLRGAYTDVDVGDFRLGQDENGDINGSGDLQDAFNDLNDDTSDGFFLDVGVRSQLTPWLEAGGGARYTDLDSGDDTALFGNLLFEMTENIGFDLTGVVGDDITTYSLGVRYTF